MKFTKKNIYIGLFSILYLIVAFSSFFHACAFFGLANNTWMSIILAFAFEVGQAAVLFSLLTSAKDRSRVMPWVLMCMFTLVQVIGNVYSSYKYIVSNSVENLRYFKEPIFVWTSLPDDQANVIIVYLVGAILPIAALLLTSMITNYLTDQEEEKLKALEKEPTFTNSEGDSLLNQNSILNMEVQGLTESNQKKDEEIENLKQQLEEFKNPKIQQIPSTEIHESIPFSEPEGLKQMKEENNDKKEEDSQQGMSSTDVGFTSTEELQKADGQESNGGESEPGMADTISEGTGVEETTKEELVEEPMDEDIQKRESHFINL